MNNQLLSLVFVFCIAFLLSIFDSKYHLGIPFIVYPFLGFFGQILSAKILDYFDSISNNKNE